MNSADRWTVYVCHRDSRHLKTHPGTCLVCMSFAVKRVEVVRASELERVEAERDALSEALEPLVEFCQKRLLTDLRGQAQTALRQSEQIVREGLAAQEP